MSAAYDNHDSDTELEAQAASDAFGLAGFASQMNGQNAASSDHPVASTSAIPASNGSIVKRNGISANPNVLAENIMSPSTSLVTRPTDTLMNINLTYEDMTRPVEGPENVLGHLRGGQGNGGLQQSYNMTTGHVEQQAMSDVDFKNQHMTFNVLNYARNPSILGGEASLVAFVGNAAAANAHNGMSVRDYRPSRAEVKAIKRKRKGKGALGEFDDPDEEKPEGTADGNGDGDAEEDSTRVKGYMGPWAGWKDDNAEALVPDEEEYTLPERKARKAVIIDKSRKEVGFGEEKSVFHGKEMHDYQGRTYMHIPRDVDTNLTGEAGSQDCFLPKTVIHTWTGHTKGVNAIRLFPKSGHLMLSASMDSRIKLWDVYHEGKCLRTFMGHALSVRDVCFNNDGTRFLSAGYDRHIKLWDTETGQCIQAFGSGQIPFCVKFNPDEDKQDIFLAGMSNKKILQYDIRTGNQPSQEYDQHLGAVNTLTFIDENRRFVSTSDDKSIRAWDFDIPVVVKYIAEPYMHSVPAVGVHPSQKFLAMQSLDNQIQIYSSPDLKQNRKKRFAGHSVAGYACEVGFSPDGKYLSSGAGDGSLVIWDFKTCRLLKRLPIHSKALITHTWLPHETSKVITGSWDGRICLVD